MSKKDDILWYRARSILLGIDHYTQSYTRAYFTAKESMHPDAIWLCKLFEETQLLEKRLSLKDLPNPDNDPRLSCFIGISHGKSHLLSENTYPFAQAYWCSLFNLTLESSDPWVLFRQSELYYRKAIRESNTNTPLAESYLLKRRELLKDAAGLGHNGAIIEYCKFEEPTTEIKWLSKVVIATIGKQLQNFAYCVSNVEIANELEANVFWYQIGKIANTFSRYNIKWDSPHSAHSLGVYHRNYHCTLAAIDMWILCSNRLNARTGKILFNRDLRKKIGQLVWKSKKEGLYG